MTVNRDRALAVILAALTCWVVVGVTFGAIVRRGPVRGIYAENSRCTIAGAFWSDFTGQYEFYVLVGVRREGRVYLPGAYLPPGPVYATASYRPGVGWNSGGPQ